MAPSCRRSTLPLLSVLSVALLAACNDPVGEDTPYHVVAVTTGPFAATAGWAVAETLVAELRDAEGKPVAGEPVHWSAGQGGRVAVVSPSPDDSTAGTTDAKGRSYAVWTLGLPEGTQVARAAAGPADTPAEFEATATVLHVAQITAGEGYACAALLDQRAVCWGGTSFGSLGISDSVSQFAAVPTYVKGLDPVKQIVATLNGTTCAIVQAGGVWCWGRSVSGVAGPSASQPYQPTPVQVPGIGDANSLTISNIWFAHACAVSQSSGVLCWGANHRGQLGTGDSTASAVPRAVVGGVNFRSVSVGGDRSCALDPAGEVWCWGDGSHGEFRPLPEAVYPLPVRPVPGHQYASIATGALATCGIQFGGVASCFGEDFGSFGSFPVTELKPGDPPAVVPVAEALATIVSDGYNGTYGRSRYGLGYVWGEPGCCDVWIGPPIMITPSIRIEEIVAGGSTYCVKSETGGAYCGRTNWWVPWWRERETLAGIPDTVAS